MAKGKKGKEKKEKGPEPVTTAQIIEDRTKMFCPRMGDIYTRSIEVEYILEDVCTKIIEKALRKRDSTLVLTSLKLSQLPDFTLVYHEMQMITEINLSKNNLFNGDQVFQALSQLGQLTKLNISHNFLNGILSIYAGELSNTIEVLNFDVNQITGFQANVGNWINLKVLSMCDNSITSLPVECSHWGQLQILNLKNNKIMEINGEILQSWSNVEKLYLGRNLIKILSEDIGYCNQLVELDLSSNGLETVPFALSQCTALKLLHLGSNKLTEVPPGLFTNLKCLREVQLYKNKLTEIPSDIGNLVDIERLSYSSNNIRMVPEEIGTCTMLRELYLSNNAKLSSIPSTAGHLRRLQELSLRKCPALKQIPATIAELPELRELDIRAPKKQVCKITPEFVELLRKSHCIIRGGVVKKAKGGGKKAKASTT